MLTYLPFFKLKKSVNILSNIALLSKYLLIVEIYFIQLSSIQSLEIEELNMYIFESYLHSFSSCIIIMLYLFPSYLNLCLYIGTNKYIHTQYYIT